MRNRPYSGWTARKTINCFSFARRRRGDRVVRLGLLAGGSLRAASRLGFRRGAVDSDVLAEREPADQLAATVGGFATGLGRCFGFLRSSSVAASGRDGHGRPPASPPAASSPAAADRARRRPSAPASRASSSAASAPPSIVGWSISRRRITSRIGSTAGFASSRYASHRHVSRPLLASRAGGAVWSFANCSGFQ